MMHIRREFVTLKGAAAIKSRHRAILLTNGGCALYSIVQPKQWPPGLKLNSGEAFMLNYRNLIVGLAILGVALGASLATSAFAQSGGTKVGVLTCNTSASLGLIIGSRQNIRCSFAPDAGGPPESYVGHITRLGLDLGVRAGGVMVWGVVAPTNGFHRGALAGNYAGVNADASLGLGAGAKVLVGGSHRTVSLQPLSVSGQAGLNLALGVAGLTLRSVR
jgi:hypothetical protein